MKTLFKMLIPLQKGKELEFAIKGLLFMRRAVMFGTIVFISMTIAVFVFNFTCIRLSTLDTIFWCTTVASRALYKSM